jgi:tRNA A-37 threonylcarbamoyl transferase component Bud32
VNVLGPAGIPFKHVRTTGLLARLSTGRAGPKQVGKFLTAYPPDEEAAATLAELLHAATHGLEGPRIPGERRYAPGSVVYSRYGGFMRRWLQLPTGRVVPARMGPHGWEEDDRGGEQNVATDGAPESRGALRGKYLHMRTLFQSPKGSTSLALVDDSEGGDFVIVKEAYAHTMQEVTGRDARDRLRAEAACLDRIRTPGVVPKLLDYWEDGESSYLVYAPIPGPTLAYVLSQLAAQAVRPPIGLLRTWMESLCSAVSAIHAAGYVSGDIKPANIVVSEDGLRLIDLELAGPATETPTGGMGTPGYASPQQIDPDTGRSELDDIYALGATLLAMAVVTDASVLPDLKQVALCEWGRDPANPVYAVVARCVEQDPRARFENPQDIVMALSDPPPLVRRPNAGVNHEALAEEIGQRLVASAAGSGQHAFWRSSHRTVAGQPLRDLYVGTSGIALFLCALGGRTRNNAFAETAAKSGSWLWETQPPVRRQRPMPGLYFGECGPALLYLRLHELTGQRVWLERARAVSGGIHAADVESPDLVTGLAGIGLLHLAVWRSSGDDGALARAVECAGELFRRRQAGRPIWRFPDDFDVLSGREFPGFSHGSAGVGYFLAEAAMASGSDRLRAASQEVADWVIEQARPALPDESGLSWNSIDSPGRSYGLNWCHGAAGMVRFLLSVHELTGEDRHLVAAVGAGRTIAAGGSWVGTSQCHGLAGNLEVLIDLAHHTGEPEWLTAARILGENLRSYATAEGWPSDERSFGCPDLMVGEAGVGAALLRLADPAAPHLVTCRPARRPG